MEYQRPAGLLSTRLGFVILLGVLFRRSLLSSAAISISISICPISATFPPGPDTARREGSRHPEALICANPAPLPGTSVTDRQAPLLPHTLPHNRHTGTNSPGVSAVLQAQGAHIVHIGTPLHHLPYLTSPTHNTRPHGTTNSSIRT